MNGVDDFAQRSPGFAYENLAVMSAHESLSCSPASRMSGGDYDGDKAFIIGFEPLVNEAPRILGEVEGWMYFLSAWLLPPGFQLGLPLEVQPSFF